MDAKKALTKVRRQFLRRTPDEDDLTPPDDLPESPYYFPKDAYQPASPLISNKPENSSDAQLLNLLENIQSQKIKEFCTKNPVSQNFHPNHDNLLFFPESCETIPETKPTEGSQEWLQVTKELYASLSNKMAQYMNLVKSDNPQAIAAVRKVKLRATLACKNIERSYPYKKMLILLKKNSFEIISTSSNDGFLKELGCTFRDVSCWKREDGSSIMSEDGSLVDSEVSFDLVNSIMVNNNSMQEGKMYKAVNSLGEKMTMQNIHIFEPAFEEMFVSVYVIIKKKPLRKSQQKRLNKLEDIKDEDINSFVAKNIKK